MEKHRAHDFEDLLSEQLQDEAFRQEYAKLEEEFSVAREVIRLRKEQNLTQAELAQRVGTSQPAIARLESGNYRRLSLSFLERVAKALNATPEIHLKKIS